jgi:glycosyltransferase involved in cell wall biosynthesis
VENGRTDLLAEVLSDIMSDADKRQRLAANAVKNVRRFQMDNIARQWRQLFESVIGNTD